MLRNKNFPNKTKSDGLLSKISKLKFDLFPDCIKKNHEMLLLLTFHLKYKKVQYKSKYKQYKAAVYNIWKFSIFPKGNQTY